MAYTTINKHTDYFSNKLWTGNGSTQNITGVGHTPDFVWIKKRTDADGARIFDAVRGATKAIFTNSTAAETTVATELSAFNSDGYTLGGSDAVNGNTKEYVGWNWKANGQGSSNTDGSINTTYTSANTTSGFSIVKYTGTGANATVGHGLGSAPKMIIFKGTSNASGNWYVYHSSLGHGTRMTLNSNGASASDTEYMNNTAPTNSLFSLGANGTTNPNGGTQIAYCFAEKTGYSKFGSYVGNGNVKGTFIYTGFKPEFVIFKRSSGTGGWIIHDNKRSESNGGNALRKYLVAQTNGAEGTDDYFTIDTLSNGFKLRSTDGESNQSNSDYVYMAFGQSLVGSNNIPCTAR